MRDVKEGWLKADKDSITCTLPDIKLLDNNFIDEAKTQSFYEDGKWTGKDRQRRCLTPANIATAEENAKQQFREMLGAMGFNKVGFN